ncbi:MAG: hypothetical protein N2114_01730 [Candidatus Goldbacteria bacterium]|nr:hypothetical protein [Candidatus Goldiibacteriota bacterium]
MEKDIKQLLTEKLNYLQEIYNIVNEQKVLIEKKEFDRYQMIENKKQELLTKIQEIEKFLETYNVINNNNFNIIQELIKKTNLLLDELIHFEKENAKKIEELNLLILGKHIEFYKKIKK